MDIAKNGRLHESTMFGIGDDPPIYEALGHMAFFVEESGIRYWRMAPHDELIIGPPRTFFCLAEPDVAYMVYFRTGGEIRLRMNPGEYEVKWFNPRTGEFLPANIIFASRETCFAAPDEMDWVLYLCNRIYK
jgi:hypothetical protein